MDEAIKLGDMPKVEAEVFDMTKPLIDVNDSLLA